MLRHSLLTLLAAAVAADTSETVRRVVMLRTSGSDLAPAATGYIYRKGGGRESVVRMAESEIMAQLADAYAPAPVSEPAHERVDGLADVDYEKIFADYRAHSDDYLDSLKRFKGRLHRTHDAGSAEDPGPVDGGAGSYRDARFESYSITGDHEKGLAGDSSDEHFDRGHRGPAERHRGEEDDAFQKVYDISDQKHYHGYLAAADKAFPGDHKYYGSSGRGHQYGSYENIAGDAKHEDAKHENDKHEDAKDSYAKHSYAKHDDAKHEDVKHGDAKHNDAKHENDKHEDADHSYAKHSYAKHSYAKHGDAKHEVAKHGDAKHDDAKLGDAAGDSEASGEQQAEGRSFGYEVAH